MFRCRKHFHVHAYLSKQFADRSDIHARYLAQLLYLCLKWLHAPFDFLVEMVDLSLYVGEACTDGAYHENVMFRKRLLTHI